MAGKNNARMLSTQKLNNRKINHGKKCQILLV